MKEQVEQELEKFSLMEASSPEFIVTRNYLETIVGLPWNDESAETLDIAKAREILDEDHYGLEDVKERILEYLAVRKLKKDTKGSIICLVGPPGVGKTSVGKSIARALGRQFFRFSVGGMRDEAEIKGHRRTYIGAMPGKIIQGLKIVKTKNPVFMIDEIDKLGVSFQGDPSSALLEVLDPEQNVAFRDHYLDLPFDISHILFVTTANTLDSIPAPLLDRMEVIRLSGYIDQEKLAIARRYLIPKSLERSGLEKGSVKYESAALLAIADGYAREAGLRNFEKALDKIHRKIARKSVMGEASPPLSIRRGGPCRLPRQARLPRRGDGPDHAPGHGNGAGLDAPGRRRAHDRGGGKPGQGGLQAHRQAGRGDAGVGEHRLLLRSPLIGRPRRERRFLGEEHHPPARARQEPRRRTVPRRASPWPLPCSPWPPGRRSASPWP